MLIHLFLKQTKFILDFEWDLCQIEHTPLGLDCISIVEGMAS